MTFPQKSSEPALFFIILVGVAVWRGAPAKDTAFVEVVLFESSPSGDYTTYTTGLQGRFSKAGATTSAEGEIVQVHPLGLCNSNNEEDLFDYGWVGVVKLEQPHLDPSCLSVLGKTKRAVQRGATAVILDVSEDPGAIDQLDRGSNDPLKRPVVFVKGGDAVKLMNIVNKQKVAWARIQHQPPQQPAEYFDTGVFLAFFMAVSLVCLLVLIRIKLKQRRAQGSVNRAAVRALEKMETRHFKAKGQRDSASVAADSICGSSASDCAICLERYLDGEELRVISCTHRFHRRCVDPWLLEHHTCPHCRCNIIEQKGNFSSTCVSSGVPAHGRRQRVALSILHPGSVHHMAPTPLTATRVGPHTNLVTATTTFGHTDRTRCPPQVSAWLHGRPPIRLDRPISQVGGAPSRLLRFCSQPARIFTQPAGGFHQPRGPFYQSSAYTSAFKRSRPHGRSFPRASCFSPNETLYQHYYDRGLTFPQAPGRTGLAPERPPDLLCPTVLHRSFALAAHSCLGPAHTCYHGNDSVCSGYLGDGLGSDSSSGAHCGRGRSSSNDSVLDSTEISTQGMFGSSSTFRSSLSSDYDPYVYRSRSPGGGPELNVGNGTPPAHRGYCSLDHSTKIELRERNSTTPPGALGGTRVDFASLAPDYRGGHSVAYGCHFEILPAASQEKCHHLGEPKFLEMFDNGQCVQELWTEASTACSSCNVSLVDRGNQEGHTCGSLGKDQLGWDSRQCCCARLSTTSDQAQPGTDGAQNLCGAGRQNHKMPQHVRPDLQHAVQRGGEEVCGVYRAVADDGDPSGSNESLMAGFHPALGERQTAGEDLKVLLT